MMITASLLLEAKNECNFCMVMEMAQVFMKDIIGPKGHQALAIQLAQLGLCTLGLQPSDSSKFCILQPPFLTRRFLMSYDLKLNYPVEDYLPRRALAMSAVAQVGNWRRNVSRLLQKDPGSVSGCAGWWQQGNICCPNGTGSCQEETLRTRRCYAPKRKTSDFWSGALC